MNPFSPSTKLLIKSIVVMFAAGAVTTTVGYFADPQHYTLAHLRAFLPVAAASGCTAVVGFLATSPMARWMREKQGLPERRETLKKDDPQREDTDADLLR